MTFLKWALLLVVSAYAGGVALLYFAQRFILYPRPETFRTAPADVKFPQAQEIVLDTADGEKIIAWHVPPKEGKPVVVFFHGNGDILAHRVPRFEALTADGTGLIAIAFRGYAGSTGSPTEAGLLQDGEAAYQFAAAHYPTSRIVVWGFSLGTGVAVAVAAQHPIAKLILEAPYTSVVDVAASTFPFVPVRWLMKDSFHSDQRIAKVTAPLLVLHGGHDQVIATKFGERLLDLAPGPKRLLHFPEARHENLDEYGAMDAVRAFLKE